jgi:phenylalanyl-tRNA synthetase beta chain
MGLGGDPDVESAGTGRHEAWAVGIAMIGPRWPRSPGDDAGDAEMADLKAIVEGLHLALGAPMAVYRPRPEDAPPHLHPGRTAELVDDAGRGYGLLGEIHPAIAEAWDLPGRPLVAVLSLPALLKLAPGHVRAMSVPATQPIDRDLAVILDESTGVGDLLRIVRSSAGATLASARLFDEYRGPQIGTGRVSYAIALRFQPESADDERGVERSLDRVRGALKHHLRAEIR